MNFNNNLKKSYLKTDSFIAQITKITIMIGDQVIMMKYKTLITPNSISYSAKNIFSLRRQASEYCKISCHIGSLTRVFTT